MEYGGDMAEPRVRLDWYRSPIAKEELAKLTTRNNWRPLLHTVAMLGFSVATGVLAFWAFHNLTWPWVVITIYLHCTFYGFFSGGAGGHELSHRSMFKSAWLNEAFIRFNGFLTWFNHEWFRRSHTGHHQYTTHHELDLEVMLPLSVSWHQWIWAFTVNWRSIWRVIATFTRHGFGISRERVLKSEWERRIFPGENKKSYLIMVNWARFVLVGHLALAVVFVITGNWILLILFTFAPFCTGWFKALTHIPQHVGMRPDIADWRQSTRTYLAGPIVRFFYWNMNYHVEHHMYAAVPFYNLPKLRKAIESDLPVASRGLISTWREIRVTLKRQKSEPGYVFSPPLPSGQSLG
jgi:fatty acid desaturase